MNAVPDLAPAVVATAGNPDPAAPPVVLLHGRGSNEQDILGLARHLPAEAGYAAVRAPIAEGDGFAWFANRGIGRPVAESLRSTTGWLRRWLDTVAPPGRPVVLVGFAAGPPSPAGCCSTIPTAAPVRRSSTGRCPSAQYVLGAVGVAEVADGVEGPELRRQDGGDHALHLLLGPEPVTDDVGHGQRHQVVLVGEAFELRPAGHLTGTSRDTISHSAPTGASPARRVRSTADSV